jgi:hypothetical protein
MNNEDDYNVNNYTDDELFDILELVNPSDSILEAKIIQMINKFKAIHNRYGNTMVTFFTNIYKHFFDVPQDAIEGFENIESSKYDNVNQVFVEDTNAPSGIAYNKELDPTTNVFKETSTPLENTSTREFKQIDYVKGTLNPLLKQTIKRIISIDSQYREQKDKLSTEFTFNLSEPLRDVVALRLYSVQIPFTWYTVGNNYGANYIYYKGNSPGINDGNFDYKIEIAPGNYTNQTLVDTLNAQFQLLQTQYTDVSFGTTKITYNTNTCKSTITTDIKNLFNESNYEIVFPIDPSLNKYPLLDASANQDGTDRITLIPDSQLRYSTNANAKRTSLFAYLGFDSNNYRVNAIYSNVNNMNTDSYTQLVDYVINNTNNTFTIKRRDNNNNIIPDVITITIPNNTYSASGIVSAINTSFSNQTRLNSTLSTITRKTITDPYKENFGKNYYEMHVYFNKTNDPFANVSGLTTFIVFPNESTGLPNTNPIWTGTNSLFNFNTANYTSNQVSYNDFNEIVAESESHQTDYVVKTNPYIVLKCMKSGFTNTTFYEPTGGSHATPSLLSNDFIIDISNSTTTTGYNFNTYLEEIQSKLNILNSTPNSYYDKYYLNNTISYDSINNKVVFGFNMNIAFYKNRYTITFGNVFTELGFPATTNIDLTNDISANKSNFGSYQITENAVLATIYPKTNEKNSNDPYWTIKYTKTTRTFSNIKLLLLDLEQEFNNFTIPSEGYKPITLSIPNNPLPNDINTTSITLNFTISRILLQQDYHVYFYDASGASGSESSWKKNLSFDTSYNLGSIGNATNSEITYITSTNQIAGNTFYMNKDTYFTIKGLTPGLTSIGNENNIIITIPKPTNSTSTYTRQEIFNIINSQLDQNPVTKGSIIYYQIVPNTNTQYVHMKIKINKIFSALDYNVVMYDPYSFVKCFVGTKSVRNVTWDSTLGWLLGFRSHTQYNLINTNTYSANSYNIDSATNIITLTSDTTMTTNIYDYFLIILDDYTQSHLNDGLVTIIPKDMSIPLPSYAQTVTCNIQGNTVISDTTGNTNRLTEKQLYAANTILNETKVASKSYSSGPYIQDVFGLIPLKLGIATGSTYVEFGGTLQNQERVYFGPVNISRMTIKLINDRGEPVDLNGANWSFSFICEQLYNLNERSKDDKSK